MCWKREILKIYRHNNSRRGTPLAVCTTKYVSISHSLYLCSIRPITSDMLFKFSTPLLLCAKKWPKTYNYSAIFSSVSKKSRKSYQWNPCQSRSQLPDHNRLHRKIQLRLQNYQGSVDYWCCFISVFHTILLEVSLKGKSIEITVPISWGRGACLVSISSIIIVSSRCCSRSVATGIITRAITVAHSSSFLNFYDYNFFADFFIMQFWLKFWCPGHPGGALSHSLVTLIWGLV